MVIHFRISKFWNRKSWIAQWQLINSPDAISLTVLTLLDPKNEPSIFSKLVAGTDDVPLILLWSTSNQWMKLKIWFDHQITDNPGDYSFRRIIVGFILGKCSTYSSHDSGMMQIVQSSNSLTQSWKVIQNDPSFSFV